MFTANRVRGLLLSPFILVGAAVGQVGSPDAAAADGSAPSPQPALLGPFECEELEVRTSEGLGIHRQDMAGFAPATWSGGRQLFVKSTAPGDAVELSIPTNETRPVRVFLHATESYDYGVVEIAVNGLSVGRINLRSADRAVRPTGPIDLDASFPEAGWIRVRVTTVAADADADGPGMLFGLDAVFLQPIDAPDPGGFELSPEGLERIRAWLSATPRDPARRRPVPIRSLAGLESFGHWAVNELPASSVPWTPPDDAPAATRPAATPPRAPDGSATSREALIRGVGGADSWYLVLNPDDGGRSVPLWGLQGDDLVLAVVPILCSDAASATATVHALARYLEIDARTVPVARVEPRDFCAWSAALVERGIDQAWFDLGGASLFIPLDELAGSLRP